MQKVKHANKVYLNFSGNQFVVRGKIHICGQLVASALGSKAWNYSRISDTQNGVARWGTNVFATPDSAATWRALFNDMAHFPTPHICGQVIRKTRILEVHP